MKLQESSSNYLNALFYGRSGSGKTTCASTAPGPVFLDYDLGTLSLKSRDIKVPTIEHMSEEDLLQVLMDPEYVIEHVVRGSKTFKDYSVETWVFDSATKMQIDLLGRPNLYNDKRELIQKGSGIMSVDRNRINNEPSIEDYKSLNWKMTNFFNAVRAMPYHTIITAHAALDDIEEDSDTPLKERSKNPTRKMGLPVLGGKLKYHADNLCDLYLFFNARNLGNGRMEYSTYSLPFGPWHARTRISKMDYKIVDPTFEKIYDHYRRA